MPRGEDVHLHSNGRNKICAKIVIKQRIGVNNLKNSRRERERERERERD